MNNAFDFVIFKYQIGSTRSRYLKIADIAKIGRYVVSFTDLQII